MNLFSLLDQAARRFPDHGAVYTGTERVSTYAKLRSRALRLAGGLRRRFGAGDRIAITSENRPEFVEMMFGIWAAAMVAVPVNYKLHAREMVQIVEDAAASAVFVSAKLAVELEAAMKSSAEHSCRTIVIGTAAYAELMSEPADPPATTPETLAWLFYTSGTTGRSKGAMLSHRNLLAMTIAHLADFDAPDENCSLIHGAPMSHGSGLYVAPYVLRGARQVVPASGRFDPTEFLDLCEHHPGSSAFLAPTMVQRLVQTGRDRPTNLRTIVYGGGAMAVARLY